ncbi:hypothetical protein JCM31826_08470 [Thermaurantimonas aggregans]|uniref:Uncharacterized protein n=1 Tax=Thermaurantimonas aggregans TaxID=2173829 RepID=A0A401XK05_9FLAO|nr:hypothetical protein [Thermaurantimonas aggregans]GCD77365.1 hypothetical protein JCM31826_08470 [Thermaurantimonas aggregans]
MQYTELINELLKYVLPSAFMLILTYMLLSNFMESEDRRRRYSLRKENAKIALPLRFQAYERLALFLERISPNQLVTRIPSKNLTARQYRHLLIKSIQSEYEFNLSQQMYISEQAWQYVVTAKSAMVGIINKLAAETSEDTDALEFSKKIINYFMEMEALPTKKAIAYLKQEMQQEF